MKVNTQYRSYIREKALDEAKKMGYRGSKSTAIKVDSKIGTNLENFLNDCKVHPEQVESLIELITGNL